MSAATTYVSDRPAFARALPSRWRAWVAARRRRRVHARDGSVVELDKGATLWIDRPSEREVHCVEGALWLTFDGEPRDHVLEQGQSLRCPHRSRLGISALERGIVRVV